VLKLKLSKDENQKILIKMIEKYCQKKHRQKQLCKECSNLLEYALMKLEKCPWGQNKPACSKCPLHCYNKIMRPKII
jgi:hypothetical protein